MWGPEKSEGSEGFPRERRTSGVSRRAERYRGVCSDRTYVKRDPIIIWQSVVVFAPRGPEGAERWQYSLAIRFEPFTLKRGVKTAKFSCTHWHGSSIKCRRVIQHEFTLGRIAQDLTVKKKPVWNSAYLCSIWPPGLRRLITEIRQIWGWVIRPVSPSTVTHPLGWW